ncbi:3166_t:CDS:2, partial [Gigaspora margarita]
EDENDIQKILSIMLPLEGAIVYNLEKLSYQKLKSTLDYLLVETLRLLYKKVFGLESGIDLKDILFEALERSLEKTMQTTLEKVVGKIKCRLRACRVERKVNTDYEKNLIKLVISSNIINELEYSSRYKNEDPIEAFFQEKLLSTRQLAKISLRINNKPKALALSFSNSPRGQAFTSIGTKIKEAHKVNLKISRRS